MTTNKGKNSIEIIQSILERNGLQKPDERHIWRYGIKSKEYEALRIALRADAQRLLRRKEISPNHAGPFGFYIAAYAQQCHDEESPSYDQVLKDVLPGASPDERADFGSRIGRGAIDFWKVPRDAHHRQHLYTLFSQGGAQIKRLSTLREGCDAGWGKLYPVKQCLDLISSDDSTLAQVIEHLDDNLDALPLFYRHPSAVEFLKLLLAQLWEATRVKDTEDGLKDVRKRKIEFRYIPLNPLLRSLLAPVSSPRPTSNVTWKLLFRTDDASLSFFVRPPSKVRSESEKRRLQLQLAYEERLLNIVRYYQDDEQAGVFVRDGSAAWTSRGLSVTELSQGAELRFGDETVSTFPGISPDKALVFGPEKIAQKLWRFQGFAQTRLREDRCLILLPKESPCIAPSAKYDIKEHPDTVDGYHVVEVVLRDTDESTTSPQDITVEYQGGEADGPLVTLRAIQTYTSALIPDQSRLSGVLEFDHPAIYPNDALNQYSQDIRLDLGRASRPNSNINFYAHSARRPEKSLDNPGLYRVGTDETTKTHVVVLPPRMKLETHFQGTDLVVKPNVPVGKVTIWQFENSSKKWQFSDDVSWTLPSHAYGKEKVPRYVVQFDDWLGTPKAKMLSVPSKFEGFALRTSDGLTVLRNETVGLQSLHNISIHTSKGKARKERDPSILLEAALQDGPDDNGLRKRYFTIPTPTNPTQYHLSQLREAIRRMFMMSDGLDSTVVLSFTSSGEEHRLKVQRYSHSLQHNEHERPITIHASAEALEDSGDAIYASASLICLEEPWRKFEPIPFDPESKTWSLPSTATGGTFLFIPAREYFRPRLIPSGEVETHRDWAYAVEGENEDVRRDRFKQMFEDYVGGKCDDTVEKALNALLTPARNLEPSAFEGLREFVRSPKAIVRYMLHEHPHSDQAYRHTVRTLEDLGFRWWSIPGPVWTEGALEEDAKARLATLAPILAEDSELLKMSFFPDVTGLPERRSTTRDDLTAARNEFLLNTAVSGSWLQSLYDSVQKMLGLPQSEAGDNVRLLLDKAIEFVRRRYCDGQPIAWNEMQLLAPIRWIAPESFDLLASE